MSYKNLDPLTAISPLDGRYRADVDLIAFFASEAALMQYRLRVEIEWFLFLNERLNLSKFPPLPDPTVRTLKKLRRVGLEEVKEIKEIEQRTKHDVKAVEQFLRNKLLALKLDQYVEWIHFGCTSEDINNLAYGLMVRDLVYTALRPFVSDLVGDVIELAKPLVSLPMLARTHGQPASPTTLGKELVVFASRLNNVAQRLFVSKIFGKMNGAVGNYNAHNIALPHLDWMEIGEDFVRSLELTPSYITTQIESHDYLTHILNDLQVLNGILLDFVRDIWGYISLGYFKQKRATGEIGSSTMPHKVNPIDFENAEGNLGIANALQSHLGQKLIISRWQRDLSDSTVMRNIGVAFAHTVLSVNNIIKGIAKLEPNENKLRGELNSTWEVLAEAVQTTMRARGIPESYEIVRRFTQGKRMDRAGYRRLLERSKLPQEDLDRLSTLTPESYIGLAEQLALREIAIIKG